MSEYDRDLSVARAEAIEAYATVESELCYVLSALLDIRHDTTAIIFFKISNSGARNGIVASLLDHIHKDKYDIYWHGQPGGGGVPRVDGLFRHINWLDSRRNEIVHWHHSWNASSGGSDGSAARSWEDLRPPFFWAKKGSTATIDETHLRAFIAKAEFVRKALHMFWILTRHPQKIKSDDELQAWLQIFQQPLPYPLPEAHRLSQKLPV
jgi:hypothetical protein